MHGDKIRRHAAILETIDREIVSSQEELREKLLEQDFEVTQATLSRDLRELGIIKTVTEKGLYKYSSPRLDTETPVISSRKSGNLLVMRTEVGLASRVAYQIDALDLEEVLGTVAGDDTLLVVIAEKEDMDRVRDSILEGLQQRTGRG